MKNAGFIEYNIIISQCIEVYIYLLLNGCSIVIAINKSTHENCTNQFVLGAEADMMNRCLHSCHSLCYVLLMRLKFTAQHEMQ